MDRDSIRDLLDMNQPDALPILEVRHESMLQLFKTKGVGPAGDARSLDEKTETMSSFTSTLSLEKDTAI